MNRLYPAMIILGIALPGSVAYADTCCGPSGVITFCHDPFCGSSATSFETTHSWKGVTPGTLKLSGTKFTIVLIEASFTYSLRYRDKELGTYKTLQLAEIDGVARARELQEMGMPLD